MEPGVSLPGVSRVPARALHRFGNGAVFAVYRVGRAIRFRSIPEGFPMNPRFLLLPALGLVLALSAEAQSIGRLRRSIDRATSGNPYAPQLPPAPGRPTQPAGPGQAPGVAPAPAPATPAQAAAERKRKEQETNETEKRVVDFLKQRVEEGSPSAAYDLAKRHEEGRGVPVNPTEARRLMELAAQRDNSDAKVWLAEHPAPPKPEAKATTKPESRADGKSAAAPGAPAATKPAAPPK